MDAVLGISVDCREAVVADLERLASERGKLLGMLRRCVYARDLQLTGSGYKPPLGHPSSSKIAEAMHSTRLDG